MFEVRLLQHDDYENLVKWWNFWKFPAPPRDYLPEEGTGGIIISKDGVDVCAGFLFLNNSKIAWLEYIVSNPEYKQKNRKEAIVELIETLCSIAKNRGYKAVFSSLKSEPLIQRYLEAGFVKGSTNTTEVIITL